MTTSPALGQLRNVVELTQAEYDALTPHATTWYFVTDTPSVYYGIELMSGGSGNSETDYDYYVTILVKQSNIVARYGPIDPTLDATDASILQLSRTGAFPTSDPSVETLILAQDPLEHWDAGADTVGMGLTFAKEMKSTLPAGAKQILLPTGKGASGFNNDRLNIGDVMFEDIINRMARIKEICDTEGKTFTVLAFLSLGGEADGGVPQATYTNYDHTFISVLRDRCAGADNTTPWLAFDILTNTLTGPRATFQAQEGLVPYSGYVPKTVDIVAQSGDAEHLSASSQRAYGVLGAAKISNIVGDLGLTEPDAATISAVGGQDSQVTLNVTAGSLGGSAIRHIAVFYKLSSGSVWLEFQRKADPSLTIVVDGLTNDSAYDFEVYIVTSAGVSLVSNSVSATPSTSLSAPFNSTIPEITGSTVEGSTLTCSTGTWSGNPTPTYAFQWQNEGVDISGATGSTYDSQASDVGYTLTCEVDATNSEGTAMAESLPTAAITAAQSGGGARAAASTIVAGPVFDISARNDNSYDGSSQTITNLGSAGDFWLGADGTVEGSNDPTFNGTAGDSAAYFSFPTTYTRRFTAKADHALTNMLHRSDSTQPWTMIFYLKPAFTFKSLLATAAHGSTPGIILWNGGNKPRIRTYNAAGVTVNTIDTFTQTYSNTAHNLIAITFDPTTNAYTYKVNSEALETGTLPSWTNVEAITTPVVLLSDTSSAFGTLNPSEFHDFIMYDKVLTETEINSLFTMLSSSKT